jgi:hypothetical protein
MKTKNRFLLGLAAIAFAGFLTVSCAKEESAGVSLTEAHPVLTMTGASFINILTGTPYTDQGAVASYKGQPLPVTTVGVDSVDPDTPGIYFIEYSTENVTDVTIRKTATRAVLISDELIVDRQWEGSFVEATHPTKTPSITQRSPGIYRISDACWQSAGPIPIEFLDLGGGKFMMYPEEQSSVFGPVVERNGISYDAATGTFTFDLIVPSQNYGWTGVFTKK